MKAVHRCSRRNFVLMYGKGIENITEVSSKKVSQYMDERLPSIGFNSVMRDGK